jgi:hypothetical protein
MPYTRFLSGLLLIIAIVACRRNENGISLPLSSALNVYYTDTISVDLATVLIDSIVTSTAAEVLAGHYKDVDFGDVTASSYFGLSLQGIDNNFDGHEDIIPDGVVAVYDSLVLYININYIYGDTTVKYQIGVHELTEPLSYKYGLTSLYSHTTFKFNPAPLGALSFTTPPSTDSVKIHINDSLGKRFLYLAKTQDMRIANNSNFKEIFHGLTVMADAPSNDVIYGYGKPTMRMYFHDSLLSPSPQYYYDFVLATADLQFNNIANTNNPHLPPGSFKESYQEVNDSKTNGEAFLLTGIQLLPKIMFPYISYLKSLSTNNVIVNKAELVITPKIGSYTENFYPPQSLVLYNSNDGNTLASLTTSTSGGTETVSPTVDYENEANTQYVFDITTFLDQKLKSDPYNAALILAPISTSVGRRAEKLVLEKSNIKLIIYLTIM